MRKRGVRPGFIIALLVAYSLAAVCCAVSTNVNVIIPQNNDPVSQRNFQNVYSAINSKPSISSGAGVPALAPVKVGDIYINTSAGKVYIATGTANSGSYAILN